MVSVIFGSLSVAVFVVYRLAPAFEQGAAVGGFEADAVFGNLVRVFGEMLSAGAGLALADQGDEIFFDLFLIGGARCSWSPLLHSPMLAVGWELIWEAKSCFC